MSDVLALLVEQLQQPGGPLGEEVEAARVVDELDVLPLAALLHVHLLRVRLQMTVYMSVDSGRRVRSDILHRSAGMIT